MAERDIEFLISSAKKLSEAKLTKHQLPGDTHHQVRDTWENLTNVERQDLIQKQDPFLVYCLLCLLLGRKGKLNNFQNSSKEKVINQVFEWNPGLILWTWTDLALRINVLEGLYTPEKFIQQVKVLHQQLGLSAQFTNALESYQELRKKYPL